MNNILYGQKINLIIPIELLNISCFFYKTKYIIFKYIYNTSNFNTFFCSIKSINNYFFNLLKLEKSVKINSVKDRQNLSFSTKKIRKQKGLGKARLGSIKSPLIKGGVKLFGPKNNKIFLIIKKKNKKLNFLFIFLNKRTHTSFILFIPIYHNFYYLYTFLNQYARSKGYLFSKILYLIYNTLELKKKKDYSISLVKNFNLKKYLEYNIIILLI